MASVVSLLEQIRDGRFAVENPYKRLVRYDGNEKAQRETAEVFELAPIRWRGVAEIPASGYKLRDAYRRYSAAERFAGRLDPVELQGAEHPKGCRCAEVTLGQIRPDQCGVFGKLCTPDSPVRSVHGQPRGHLPRLVRLRDAQGEAPCRNRLTPRLPGGGPRRPPATPPSASPTARAVG